MTPDELYIKYHRLAWKVARIMQRSYGLTEEDVEDIAMSALGKVVMISSAKIDARGHAGYVRTVINNASRSELQRILKAQRFSSNHTASEDSEHSVSPRHIEDEKQHLDSALIHEDLLSYYLSTLTPYERRVIDMMLGSPTQPPMELRDIASAVEVPLPELKQTLERTYIRARKRLERHTDGIPPRNSGEAE
jgi:RNA polymerase sigma factor (sigma-70 family)